MKKQLIFGIAAFAICIAISSCEKTTHEPTTKQSVPDLTSVSAAKVQPGYFVGDFEDENDFTCLPGPLCFIIVTPSVEVADPIPGYSSYVPAAGFITLEVEAYLDGPSEPATLFEVSEIKVDATGPETLYRPIGVQ